MVILIASDGAQVDIDNSVARHSPLIGNFLNDDEKEVHIPLPFITSGILTKVMEYCKFHHNDPPVSHDDLGRAKEHFASVWDDTFITNNRETLIDIILAAHYLGIKALLNLGCMAVADMIAGKSVNEIRTQFNIDNDFTPEEEEEIRRETAWIE
ncbi:E3 ubiquitin ligase SCF complex, Skp subunit [Rickenella mellea]|uniref:E3 ubiquitin ligase complex SCF subunit n=1 Tax=Rickenella mellea TaxID=50990 RepID=A0A4Y7PWD3_9AGAM|nr:E3 ubiquitin ligase SCF complex, Skp subunit [Rickenella mellea]